jgi:small ligand-binding sensory domain FIST
VEAAEHARDELAGEAPSLGVLLGSRAHTELAVDVLDAVQVIVEPPALIGCVAQAIVAGRHEIEDGPAVAVWLATATCSPPARSVCACPARTVCRSCRRAAGRLAMRTSSPARTAQ